MLSHCLILGDRDENYFSPVAQSQAFRRSCCRVDMPTLQARALLSSHEQIQMGTVRTAARRLAASTSL